MDQVDPPKVIIKFPASMVCLYGFMQKVAHARGYALACHGSMNRDFDLIAIPWVEKPSTPDELAHAIAKAVGAHIPSYITLEEGKGHVEQPQIKPHGRECWVIPLGGGPYIDLSIMRPLPHTFVVTAGTETTICLPGQAENEGQ